MNIIYLDCFSGISGDMLIASLLDLGIDFDLFQREIDKLGLGLGLSCSRVNANGIMSRRFSIDNPDCATARYLPDILSIIDQSSLSREIKQKAAGVFTRLAEAEAQVHGVPLEKIHFHEIGALDTIVDVVGVFICLDLLGINKVYASLLPWCHGLVNTDHGTYPLPAPATALLLKGIPCFSTECEIELVTPTGAALITSLATAFGPMPDCTPLEIGYGAGSKTRADRVPNLLRAIKGSLHPASLTGHDMVAILEAEVDDLNPELLGYLFEKLLSDEDVLDLFTSPVLMKKNRPGFLLTIIAHAGAIDKVTGILFRESSTLGVRHRLQARSILPRHHESIETPWGPVRIKVAHLPEGGMRIKPEFDDCRSIAATYNIPLPEVYAAVNKSLHRSNSEKD